MELRLKQHSQLELQVVNFPVKNTPYVSKLSGSYFLAKIPSFTEFPQIADNVKCNFELKVDNVMLVSQCRT